MTTLTDAQRNLLSDLISLVGIRRHWAGYSYFGTNNKTYNRKTVSKLMDAGLIEEKRGIGEKADWYRLSLTAAGRAALAEPDAPSDWHDLTTKLVPGNDAGGTLPSAPEAKAVDAAHDAVEALTRVALEAALTDRARLLGDNAELTEALYHTENSCDVLKRALAAVTAERDALRAEVERLRKVIDPHYKPFRAKDGDS